ncbi:hypothetical protein ACRALDRAFT_1092086 [Sodiomyces alcalophilus JCM 7366]|uniref:uncharacterized protein n=1 Tax=Sodiomyces alcalophilus JCM 7366 TaxID=591952 RepID=UPI0039B38C09
MNSLKLSVLLPLLAGSAEAAVARPLETRQGPVAADRWDMPVDYTPFGNLATVELGVPGQEVTVFLDWTWANNFIQTPRCYGQWDRELCMSDMMATYDPRNSSTFVNVTDVYPRQQWFPNHFFFTEPSTVDHGIDSVQLGPVRSPVINQFSDTMFDMTQFFLPFTVVFGMSPTLPGQDDSYDATFYQQYKQGLWKEPLVGYVWCYDEGKIAACGGNDAIQSWGGYRKDLVKGKVFWYDNVVFPDINEISYIWDPPFLNYWATPLQDLWIGDELQPTVATSENSGKGAVFNHATFGRGIPLTQNAYNKLIQIVGGEELHLDDPTAVNNGEQQLYSVSCEKINSYPPVKYQFVGHDKVWKVPAKHYIDQLEDGTCVLNARVTSDGDKFLGSFGDQFLKDKQIIFDFENLKVGLAEIKWPKC